MASASAIANLFSSIFFPQSKPPPPQPLQFPTTSTTAAASNRHFDSLSSSRTREGKNELLPLQQATPSSSFGASDEIMSVVCPSLAYSNTLFFKSAYNVQVIVDDNEPEEKLLNRFRREVMRAGVIQECRRRRFHENRQDKDKRKTREAAKRNRKRRPFQPRASFQDKQEAAAKKKKEDDDQDNWELPSGGLPY